MRIIIFFTGLFLLNWNLNAQDYNYLFKDIQQFESNIRTKKVLMAPTIDFSANKEMHTVIAAGTDSIYQGHPTTILSLDSSTIYCVWTNGHGGFCGPMKKSTDGGNTWSLPLAVPESWLTVRNCPAIYRLTTPVGNERLFVYAGSGGKGKNDKMFSSYSDDDGKTWSEMMNTGLGPVSMPFCTIVAVDNGKKLIGLTNTRRPGEKTEEKSCILVKSESLDGGLTWSPLAVLLDIPGLKPCEPQIIRSPNGKQLLCLIRENAKRTSLMMTSEDEGKTWSKPVPVTFGLSGDRHQAKYLPDGRLIITFRDTGKGSPTRNHFVAWVGTYDDIVKKRPGNFRLKLLHSYKGGDCGYSGIEILPDNSIVATTYIKYEDDSRKNSVVCVRFRVL